MDNDVAAALLGRVMAQGAAVEMLLTLVLRDKPDAVRHTVFQALRSAAHSDTGEPTRHDGTVLMRDVRVHAGEAMERMLERTHALLADAARS